MAQSSSTQSVSGDQPRNPDPGREDHARDEVGFYDDPSVYDILHTPGTAEEVTGLERTAGAFVRSTSTRQTWLEPACGSGRYLRVATSRGYNGVGFDLSASMIDYARAFTRPEPPATARFEVASMESFIGTACEEHSIDFAFNPINSIRHLVTDQSLLGHFEQVARALKPGGVYAVGMGPTVYGLEPPSEDTWTGARGPCRVTQHVQYTPPTGHQGGDRIERVVSHLVIETPSGERHTTSTYGLRTYSIEQWDEVIGRSALRVVGVVDPDGNEADVAPMGYRVFVLARK